MSMILRINTVLRVGQRPIGAPSGPLIWRLGHPPAGPPLRPAFTIQFFMVSVHLLWPVWQLSYDFQRKHPVEFFMSTPAENHTYKKDRILRAIPGAHNQQPVDYTHQRSRSHTAGSQSTTSSSPHYSLS